VSTYKVEDIQVGDLQVDRRVQREAMKTKKVEDIVRAFNEDALGIVTVSRRTDRGLYIIDGWHRTEAVRRLTDGVGTVKCHVFEGLTVPEEALMFLALNHGDRPTQMDKFKVRLTAGDENAVEIDQIVRSYGWTVGSSPSRATINAVGVLERIHVAGKKLDQEPPLLEITMKAITKAWGDDRFGGQAVILEGVARLLSEHGSLIDFGSLVSRMADTKGGPRGLHSQASQFAAVRGVRVAMAVADILTESYNKGRRNRTLPPWRHRK
jgi:hypothetical protein